tara:strand:- start:22572 stop:27896 length:5325 start_codon:yes stop_codon:yes gene_type:complete
MNKSVDERLIPTGEYIDALNVRLGSTENTEIGAVENSRGNSILTDLQFQGVPLVGDVRTIGVYEDGINETLYWFIHNENNPNSVTTGVVDMIVSYNTNIGSLVYHVISTSVLNFDFKYLITGVSKIENLLFFTDDLNPPRVINIKRNYDDPGPGTVDDVFEEEDVSVIVKPPGFEDFDATAGQVAPLGAPFIKLIAIPGFSNAGGGIESPNYMDVRFLSFAYRYRYEDGQYSATSLFTNPAFQPQPDFELSLQNFWNDAMKNRFNGCRVTVSTGSKRVKEIDILFKLTGSNVINVIKRYDKEILGINNNQFYEIEFLNSEIYSTLGSDELLRLYDNVPRTAKAQTIQGNRLMYGNYVDQYDIVDAPGGSKIPITYHVNPITETIAGQPLPNGVGSPVDYTIDTFTGGTHTEPLAALTFDLSDAAPAGGAPLEIGTTFKFEFSMQQVTPTTVINNGITPAPTATIQSSPFTVGFLFTVDQPYADINTMLNSSAFKNRIGGSVAQGFAPGTALEQGLLKSLYPCNDSNTGATLGDKFYATADSPMVGTSFILVSGGITNAPCAPAVLDTTPFPIVCTTNSIASGVTSCGAAPLTPCAAITPPVPPATQDTGQMIVTGTDMGVFGIQVGDIVYDQLTGLSAAVIAPAPVAGDEFVNLEDIDGGLATLAVDGTTFVIIPGGAPTAQLCFQDGFDYTVSGESFTIKAPATQYFQADGSAGGVFANAFRYYQFIEFSCFASYKLTADTSSLHSNRDYQVGIVYMDEYGRSSTVLTSQEPTVFFDAGNSVNQNKMQVNLSNIPPYWATKYKFVVKPSQGTYETIFSNLFYEQDGTATLADAGSSLPIAGENDPSQVWFRLEGQNQNVLKVGDELIVKSDTQGPLPTLEKAVVLAIEAYSSRGVTNKSLKGLYMLLKPSGWTTESIDQSEIFYPQKSKKNESGGSISGSCITAYSLNFSNGIPYDIPAGSTIRIKLQSTRGGGACRRRIYYDRTFISTQSYGNFHQWAIGDDLESQMFCSGNGGSVSPGVSDVDGMNLKFFPNLYSSSSSICTAQGEFNASFGIYQNAAGSMYAAYQGALTRCSDWGGLFPGRARLKIEVTRTSGIFCFETTPQDADPNLYYDASSLLDIGTDPTTGKKFHKAKQNFDPSTSLYSLASLGQDQVVDASGNTVVPLVTMLDAYNCYTFGNGVESYKIYDSPSGRSFNLGERTLAVSNQDFQEADRFAGMTYSGVYSSSANSNNLNEFNLGLANFKDLETTFGPIQKLHARETDILVLQEDRISYVLAGKNVITDSTGGGAIASVPQVLGTQVARIEEYGISFNPESFTSWGYDMFFTDTKRGAVLNLRGASQGSDQLQVVSTYGMNSWFRDCFNANLTTQKLGGYDPYMKEYVLGTNLRQVPMPVDEIPCGTSVSQLNATQPITFDVNLGLVIGQVDIPFSVNSGTVTITVEWDGAVVASASAFNNGMLSFNKTTNTPSTCTVTCTPSGGAPIVPATYKITVRCPKEKKLTVIQVVVNSNNYNGQFIHTNYNWFNSTNVSAFTGFSSAELNTPDAAEYSSNTGIQSLNVIPYNGASIRLRTEKYGIDNFDFDPSIHKFRIHYSTTLYNNVPSEIQTLLTASSVVSGAITNPSPGVYEAVEPAFTIPGDKYLYLIWDFRIVGSSQLCYCSDPSSAEEVCCLCEVPCKFVTLGPLTATQPQACISTIGDPGSALKGFTGNGALPTLGSVLYNNTKCNLYPTPPSILSGYAAPGFYRADSSIVAPFNDNKWIEIGANGVVISEGTC